MSSRLSGIRPTEMGRLIRRRIKAFRDEDVDPEQACRLAVVSVETDLRFIEALEETRIASEIERERKIRELRKEASV